MKLLRETIRRILLENQQHYQKMVESILSRDLANINQALELALAMGYVTDLQHTNPYVQNPMYVKHRWSMKDVHPEFQAEIKRQRRGWELRDKLQIFYDRPSQKPGEIAITLYVPKEIQ